MCCNMQKPMGEVVFEGVFDNPKIIMQKTILQLEKFQTAQIPTREVQPDAAKHKRDLRKWKLVEEVHLKDN